MPRITFSLPDEYYDRLEQLAQLEERSLAKQTALFVKRGIDKAIKDGLLPPLSTDEEEDDDND